MKSDSILEVENRFGSVRIGESEIGRNHLYPIRRAFSTKIEILIFGLHVLSKKWELPNGSDNVKGVSFR